MTRTQPSAFGILLRQHRIDAGLTQEELSERAAVSTRTVSDVERGIIQNPRSYTVRQLADALQLSEDDRQAFSEACRSGTVSASSDASRSPSSLPVELTSFVGRDRDVAFVSDRLRERDVRLLTLVGPGGIGKTRLAVRVGMRMSETFSGGVTFVSLGSIQKPELVPTAIASALGLEEMAGRETVHDLAEHFGDRHALLILDNFEHLLAGVPLVGRLLEACPLLTVMVTSRAVLRLSAEQVIEVPPLAVPEDDSVSSFDEALEFSAIALFVERARVRAANFGLTSENLRSIANLCRRVDGLPLAIELAAARAVLFAPPELGRRLSQSMNVLTGGARDAPARQQTLRATIDWSYGLLAPHEQKLFAALAVFRDGFTVEAAEMVCGVLEHGQSDVVSTLTSLVEQSLVRPMHTSPTDTPSETRFTMLETIREYAREKLDASADRDVIRRRHAEYFVRRTRLLRNEISLSAVHAPPSVGAARMLEQEYENARSALSWAVERREVTLGLQLAVCLRWTWKSVAVWEELSAILHDLLAGSTEVPPLVRAEALLVAGAEIDSTAPDAWTRKHAFFQEALELFRASDDRQALLSALIRVAGSNVYNMGSVETGEALFEEALALGHELGSSTAIGASLRGLGEIARNRWGDVKRAEMLFVESLRVERAASNTCGVAYSLHALAWHALFAGDGVGAMRLADNALATYRELDRLGDVAMIQFFRALAALHEGETAAVHAVFRESAAEPLFGRLGVATALWLRIVASAFSSGGQPCVAARLLGAVSSAGDMRLEARGFAPFVAFVEQRLWQGRSQIDDESWERAWNEGLGMSLREAVALALKAAPASEPAATH